jgi:hypothetical protein
MPREVKSDQPTACGNIGSLFAPLEMPADSAEF